MSTKIRLFLICCLIFPMTLFSQRPSLEVLLGTKNEKAPQSKVDTLGKDSLKVSIVKNVKISKDALEDPVDYLAKDSIVFDNANNLVHLYGDAQVKYQTIVVKAAYIVLNIKENLALAEAKKDSSGRTTGSPLFTDKEQNFKAQKMRYNFKSKKGIVYDVQTKQENLYVLGEKTKFVGKKDTAGNDVIYSRDAILTTCSDPHPHFGIRAKKLKVIANKLVIVGASNLEIGGVPTPVWLPFGFYPVTKTKQTGLIFPERYGYQNNLGLGVEGIGWYFPINQHFDAKVTGKYYTNGTWGVKTNINYNFRYKYQGGMNITFDNLAQEVEVEGVGLKRRYSRPISFSWQHTQAASARPNQSFSANLSFSTNASVLQKNIQNDVRSVSSNTNSSGVNYSRSFPGRPYSISAGLQQNQDIRSHSFALTPSLNLNVNTLYPLKNLKREGKDDLLNTVFESFNIQTGANLNGAMNTYDTILFKKESINKRFRAGLRYNASASLPLTLFKFITISPNVNFSQNLNFDQIKKTFTPGSIYGQVDSILADGKKIKTRGFLTDGKVDTLKSWIATPISSFSTGVSANTSLYGTSQFKRGYLKGLRHKVDLSLGFSYAPNLGKTTWSDSIRLPRRNLNEKIQYQQYSIFEGGVLGTPSYNPKARGTKTLAINTTHNLEIKVKAKKDSVARKIALLRSFNIGTSIDLNADSLGMSSFTPQINQSFLNNMLNITLATTLTPYVQGQIKNSNQWANTKEFLWNKESLYTSKDGSFRIPKPFALQNASMYVTTSASYSDIKALFSKKENQKVSVGPSKQDSIKKESTRGAEIKENFKDIFYLIENFRLSHSLQIVSNRNAIGNRDTIYIATNSLSLNGSIPLSPNWNMNFGNIGYDFQSKKPNYSSIGISRDLHCWELAGSWYPNRGGFSFTLKVKNAPLDFLKAPIQKSNPSALGGYRF